MQGVKSQNMSISRDLRLEGFRMSFGWIIMMQEQIDKNDVYSRIN